MISHCGARGTPAPARQEVRRAHNSVPMRRRALACVLEIQDRALGMLSGAISLSIGAFILATFLALKRDVTIGDIARSVWGTK